MYGNIRGALEKKQRFCETVSSIFKLKERHEILFINMYASYSLFVCYIL